MRKQRLDLLGWVVYLGSMRPKVGWICRCAVQIGTLAAVLASSWIVAEGQSSPAAVADDPGDDIMALQQVADVPEGALWQWRGLPVTKIEFEGVTFDPGDTLPEELAQKAGEPLDPEKVRASSRRLFASGRYVDLSVRGVREGDGVRLIFSGISRYYVGRGKI